MTDTPKTLLEAVRYFADPKACFEHMLQAKWPESNPTCPKCGSERVGVIRSRSMLQCKEAGCRKQFSVKVDTIFEDSPLSLDKWFVAIWCIANAKNGISSCELSRASEVEVDETFIGGKSKNMHRSKREKRIRGRGTVGKAIVQGLLERGGEVRTALVASRDDETLATNVRHGIIFSDRFAIAGRSK